MQLADRLPEPGTPSLVAERTGVAPCRLCGGADMGFILRGYDRLFARPEDYTYVRCAACGLVSLHPLPAADEIAAFYPPEYYEHIRARPRNLKRRINRLAIRYYYGVHSRGRSPWLRSLFAVLSSRILNGLLAPWGTGRVLDVGCGRGEEMETYRELGWTVCGIEMNPDAAATARARGLRVHTGDVFDAPFGREFDVVLLSHVIEHVPDPVATLSRSGTFLAPAGKIVVVTPNVRSLGFWWYRSCWYPLDAPRHLHLFDPHTLALLGRRAGVVPRRIVSRASAALLCASRQYAKEQGPTLPPALTERAQRVRVRRQPSQADRLHRQLVAPLAWTAARVGHGELLYGEFGLRAADCPMERRSP